MPMCLTALMLAVMFAQSRPDANHSFDGLWTADLAASRFNGRVDVKAATLEFIVSVDAVAVTNHTIDVAGKDVGTGTTTFRTDGRPHPHDELLPGLTAVAQWHSPTLLDTVLTRPNGIVDHVAYDLSESGSVLIVRTAGPFGTQEIVFRRQSR